MGKYYWEKMFLMNSEKLSGGESLDYIYGHIYFEDLKNLSSGWIRFIINPKNMFDQGFIFNKNWVTYHNIYSIHIKKTDSIPTIKKLNKIRQIIKNPESWLPEIMQHEILFDKEIDLTKYLLAIICNCSDDEINKIKSIIKDKPYKNTSFIIGKDFPSLDKLLKKKRGQANS